MLKVTTDTPQADHSFEQHWPNILPTVIKLIHNQPISKLEWQNLFYDLNKICTWDERGCEKLVSSVSRLFSESFIYRVRDRLTGIEDGQQQLKEYVDCWSEFSQHCLKFPVAFQQLDMAIKNSSEQYHDIETPIRNVLMTLWNQNILMPYDKGLQLLANHCDLLLRRSTLSKKLSPDDLERRLREILLLLKAIKDKATFVRHHKLHLIKRLFHNSSASIDREEKFLLELRELHDMPLDQINKMSRMIKDIKSSEEFQRQYRKVLQSTIFTPESNNNNNNNNNESFGLIEAQPKERIVHDILGNYDLINIKILNPSAWNRANDSTNPSRNKPVNLPTEISNLIPGIETFYTQEHSKRTLDWCHNLSTGTLEFISGRGKYDLEVTAAQLSVLLAFNDEPVDGLSFSKLKELTKMDSLELNKVLLTLMSNAKLKVPLIESTKYHEFNTNLSSVDSKLRINREFVLM